MNRREFEKDHILFTWMGDTDIKAYAGEIPGGPLHLLMKHREYDFNRVVALTTYNEDAQKSFHANFKAAHPPTPLHLEPVSLSHAGAFREIFENVRIVLDKYSCRERSMLTSPGSKAMGFTWLMVNTYRQYRGNVLNAFLDVTQNREICEELDFPWEMFAELREEAKVAYSMAQEISPAFSKFIHKSPALKQVLADATLLAKFDVPILIQGATGAGKDVLAKGIHAASNLRGEMVSINCGAIPTTLLESELFGNVEGAFTDAKAKTGLILKAEQGTLFLDEIGEMDETLQIKLLRVLQDRKIRPVGGLDEYEVNFRLITATHKDLITEVNEGRFREDLFYRILCGYLYLPPLNGRSKPDKRALIDYFWGEILNDLGEAGKGEKELTPEAYKTLIAYHWPGNARELENTLKRLYIHVQGKQVLDEDVERALIRRPTAMEASGSPTEWRISVGQLKYDFFKRADEGASDQDEAADLLGVSKSTLRTVLRKKHLCISKD